MEIKPSLEQLGELSRQGNMISVYAELPNDLDTPVGLFMKLSEDSPSFLLESVERGEQVGRYSYLGVNVDEAFVLKDGRLEHRQLTDDGVIIHPVEIPSPAARRSASRRRLSRCTSSPDAAIRVCASTAAAGVLRRIGRIHRLRRRPSI